VEHPDCRPTHTHTTTFCPSPHRGNLSTHQPRIFLTVHTRVICSPPYVCFGNAWKGKRTKSTYQLNVLPCTGEEWKNNFSFSIEKTVTRYAKIYYTYTPPPSRRILPPTHTKTILFVSELGSCVCVVVLCVAYLLVRGKEPNPRFFLSSLLEFVSSLHAHSRMDSRGKHEMVVVGSSSSTPMLPRCLSPPPPPMKSTVATATAMVAPHPPVVNSSSSFTTTLKRPCSFVLPHRSEKKVEEEMEPSPVSDVRSSTTSPLFVLTTTSDTHHPQQQQEEHPHQDKKARCLPLSFSHTTVVSSSDEEEEEEEDHVVNETAPPTLSRPPTLMNAMDSTNTNTSTTARNTHHVLLLQNKYDPVNVAVLSKLELSLWRKQQRQQRNRISAAKSRQSQKLRMVELQDEVADWQRRVAQLQEQIQDHQKKKKTKQTTLLLHEEESNKSDDITSSIIREEAPVVVLSTNMAATTTTTTTTTLPTDILEPNPNARRISPKEDMVLSFHHDSTMLTPKNTTTSSASSSSASSSNSIHPVSSTSSSSSSNNSSTSSSLASLFELLPTVPPSKMISRQALSRLINPFTT
jgi:hypothetical protein